MSDTWRSVLRIFALLGLGLCAGAIFGLIVGWVAWPIEFSEADPTILETDFQRDYTVMIAAAYSLDGDINLANRRLRTLGKEDAPGWLLALTVDYILEGADEAAIQHLVGLAADLGLSSPVMEPYTQDREGGSRP